MPTRAAIRKWLLLLPVLALTVTLSQGVQRNPAAPQLQIGFLFTVDSTGDGHCTLRAAIQASNTATTVDVIVINLPAGSVINLPRVLPDVSDSVSISGPGADKLTVRRDPNAASPFRIFRVTATGGVELSGLTISHGVDTLSGIGGGILNANAGTVSITNCILANNFTVGNGAAIANGSGTVIAVNSTFVGNNAVAGGSAGGAISNGTGTTHIRGCTFTGNSAGRGGGYCQRGQRDGECE